MKTKDKVCPIEKSGLLLSKVRKLVHNPKKMFAPYLGKGDSVLEIGCGPGYFTLPMARMAGGSGKVYALDLQKGMLDIVEKRAKEAGLQGNIESVLASATDFRLPQKVDFALLFYVIHEIPDILAALKNLHKYCKKSAHLYVVEPAFHVSKSNFAKSLQLAQEAGFVVEKRFGLLDRVAILRVK